MWCIQEITPEYRERMYALLDLYNEPYDKKRPVICIDEKPKQLVEEKRTPIPMKPGNPEKYDYEYKRNGSINIFVGVEPKRGKRYTQVTDRKTKKDFAKYLKSVLSNYKKADLVRVVVDNFGTHTKKALIETFGKKETQKIFRNVQFYYTPKHASWLNQAEIEIGVMDTQCTKRRIPNKKILTTEVNAWTKQRNKNKSKINWTFTKKDANKKLAKHYVK